MNTQRPFVVECKRWRFILDFLFPRNQTWPWGSILSNLLLASGYTRWTWTCTHRLKSIIRQSLCWFPSQLSTLLASFASFFFSPERFFFFILHFRNPSLFTSIILGQAEQCQYGSKEKPCISNTLLILESATNKIPFMLRFDMFNKCSFNSLSLQIKIFCLMKISDKILIVMIGLFLKTVQKNFSILFETLLFHTKFLLIWLFLMDKIFFKVNNVSIFSHPKKIILCTPNAHTSLWRLLFLHRW